MAVADNQFTLAAADREHGVNRENTGLQRNSDGFTLGHAGRLVFNRKEVGGLNGAESVNGASQCVHHTAEHGVADGDTGHFFAALHLCPLA